MNITFSRNEFIYNYFITSKRRIAILSEINDYINALSSYMNQNNICLSINNNMEDSKLFNIYFSDKQIYYILDPCVNTNDLISNCRVNYVSKVINKLLAFDRKYTLKNEENKDVLIIYYKSLKRNLLFEERKMLNNLISTNEKINKIDDILDEYDKEEKYGRK